jgi:hypothetical protein
MADPTTSDAASAVPEDQAIRERVKGLTSQVLQQGRVDPEAVRDIVRAVIGGPTGTEAVSAPEARERFVEAVRAVDEELARSASAAHIALQLLASRGRDFSDNDLKGALASLRDLERDCAAAVSRINDAMSGNLRREMMELATHAQNVGVEASARVATMVSDIAGGVAAAPGIATVRDASVRMALLASGVFAGVADALRDQARPTKST